MVLVTAKIIIFESDRGAGHHVAAFCLVTSHRARVALCESAVAWRQQAALLLVSFILRSLKI